jgi:uncharacterized membrane protein YjjP (DUF1212 family)
MFVVFIRAGVGAVFCLYVLGHLRLSLSASVGCGLLSLSFVSLLHHVVVCLPLHAMRSLILLICRMLFCLRFMWFVSSQVLCVFFTGSEIGCLLSVAAGGIVYYFSRGLQKGNGVLRSV